MKDHIDTPIAPVSVLLAQLQRQGFALSATPEGELQVRPASLLDAATRIAISHHKLALVALAQEGENTLDDDRQRCCDCYHLQAMGNCAKAASGRLPGVPRWYFPAKDALHRCHLFCALPY